MTPGGDHARGLGGAVGVGVVLREGRAWCVWGCSALGLTEAVRSATEVDARVLGRSVRVYRSMIRGCGSRRISSA